MFEFICTPHFYFRDVQFEDNFMIITDRGHGPEYCSRNNGDELHGLDPRAFYEDSWAWPMSLWNHCFETLNPYSEDEYVHLTFCSDFQTLADSGCYEDNDNSIVDFLIFPFLT